MFSKKMLKKKILITSAAGLTGTYLIKQLYRKKEYILIGTDMQGYVPQKERLAGFYKTAVSNSPEYVAQINSIVTKEKIDVIIPVSSFDMEIYTQHAVQEQLYPAKMLVMDYDTHKILHHKANCGKFLNSLGIHTPKVICEDRNFGFPCIIKANRSSGSKGVVILKNKDDYLYWKQRWTDHTIFEYLEGREYTVDCLFNQEGRCVGYNPRERLKTSGGGAVITSCVMEKRLETVIEKLESCKRIKGPINFQYKINDGQITVFDFNTRLASGGLPLSVKAGFNIPELLIRLASGESVEQWKPGDENTGLTMLRYYEEMYVRKQDEDIY